jgi:activating signal cointegrator 1
MRCLSLWQPWASVIFEHDDKGVMVKPDETRGWPTRVRGRIAIHAARFQIKGDSLQHYKSMLLPLGLRWRELPFGCIIGTVDLARCISTQLISREREDWQLVWGDYRPIGDDGKDRYAFVLRNPIKLAKPIPWKGRQGFFNVPGDLFPEGENEPVNQPLFALKTS